MAYDEGLRALENLIGGNPRIEGYGSFLGWLYKNRLSIKTLKNVLPKYIKEELVKSIRQQIDTISCIYYFLYSKGK